MTTGRLASLRVAAVAASVVLVCHVVPCRAADEGTGSQAAALAALANIIGCPEGELTLEPLPPLPTGHVWEKRVVRYRIATPGSQDIRKAMNGLLLFDTRHATVCRIVLYDRLAGAPKYEADYSPPESLRVVAQAIAERISGFDVSAMAGPTIGTIQSRLYEYTWQERAAGSEALTGTSVGVALSPATGEWVALSIWRADPKVTVETVGLSEAAARDKALERVRPAPDVEVGERGQLMLSMALVPGEGPGWVFELRDRRTGRSGHMVIDAQTGAVVTSTLDLPAQ
ncbi:MAG: hypothetical protein HPY69_13300 [Armatimonadetes bacterium]|nr:hypothetical protein [Armatimonadota bacterium]